MTVSTAICRITVLMSGLLLVPAGAPALAGEVHVTDLRCKYLTEPVGIDETHPRLSWVITSDERGQKQTAYQVLVARSQEQLNAHNGDLWDSGKVDSEQSVHVAYAGKTLQSGQRCYWKVRVWDKEGDVSQWSAPAMWSMGLLNPEDWKGPWIGLDKAVFAENYPAAPAEIDFEGCRWIWYPEKNAVESAPRGARFFRKHFTLPETREIVRGTFAVAVDNQCVLYLNGERTGDHAEWKNGAAFTVTDLLHPGENVIAVQANNRDDAAGFIGKLLVEFDEGEPLAVVTNESWKAMKGPGNDWQQLGFDDKGWKTASDLGPANTEPWSMPTAAVLGPTQTMPSPLLRKTFDARTPIKAATAYISGLGYYELRLNGEKAGDHELDPAFTRYDRRVLYSTYDVTDQIKEGPNAIGVMLGHGWYDMHTRATWDFDRAPWRAEPALLCQLRIEYADGSTEIIATDASWQAAPGPIYFDSIRNGERYDARLEKPGWDTADYQEKWPAAALVEGPAGKLAAQMLPPARIVKTIEPVNIEEVSPGTWRFDMGQNISGKAELRVSGPAGTEITLKYRELLNEDGTLDHRNAVYVFSDDFQTDTYILKGKGTEVWSPRFVYHGYRYVQVEGLPNPPTEATLRAQVVHTDFETAGEFECSNPLLNRIQQNALWSYVGNYMGYPTDCPQREKNGWTGDAHLAAEMGLMNFRPAAAYTKWLDDFADEQNEAGEYAAIIPTCGWGYGIGPSWDCAYVLIPWYLYQYCGDTRILERHYENLKRYVEFLGTKADNYIVDYGLGDWCPPLGGSGSHKSPRMLTSTAYYYKDAELLARMAKVLGKTEDAAQYSALADNIKQAFNERLYNAETGVYAGNTQTSQACALYQGLATERDKVFGQLLTQIEAADGHLDCGILGTKYLIRVLSDFGRTDVAYGIAAKTTFPSWGHWLEQGATTLWERWDGDGSHNHIMFGDVSAWFYAALAGIAPDAEAPGFKRIIMHPRPVPGLTWARAWHDSPYGRIASRWQCENGRYQHEIQVPVNASALVYVPDTGAVTESGYPVAEVGGVKEQAGIEGYRVFEVGSGRYLFEIPLPSQSDLLRY